MSEETPDKAAAEAEQPAEAEACPSLYLYRDGDTSELLECKFSRKHPARWGHKSVDGGQWEDSDAVPSPWPLDQEPPAGINLLRDTDTETNPPGALRFLCRASKHWVWSDTPGIPPGPYQMQPWHEAAMDADGDLIVVRP